MGSEPEFFYMKVCFNFTKSALIHFCLSSFCPFKQNVCPPHGHGGLGGYGSHGGHEWMNELIDLL